MARISEDRETAEMMLDELVDLEVNPGYQRVVRRLEDLLSQDRQLLEQELEPRLLMRLQGRVAARKEDLAAREDLISQLRREAQTDLEPEQGD